MLLNLPEIFFFDMMYLEILALIYTLSDFWAGIVVFIYGLSGGLNFIWAVYCW